MKAAHFLRILVVATTLGATSTVSFAKEDALSAQAKENVEAVLKGDYAKIVEFTHPEIVREMGGKEAALAITRQSMEQLKSQGAKMVSIVSGKPSEVVREGDEDVAFVPYTMQMVMGGKNVTLDSYVVAASTPGSSRWTFIDGSSINEKVLAEKYPTLVSKVGIPKKRNSLEDDIRAMSEKMKKETGKSLEETVEEKLEESRRRVIFRIDLQGLRGTIERHFGKSIADIPTATLKHYMKAKGYVPTDW